MPIFHHNVAQYSDEYDRLKLGIPTSSHFHKVITPQGKPSRQWREYACVLIAERILQRKIEFYNSPAMERGLIVEADAVAARVFVPGRDYRLGDPTSAVLAAVEHAHGGVPCRGLSEALDAHILGDKAG